MEKIKIAVVGTGSIAQGCHLPVYQRRDDVELVACVDIDFEKAKKAAEKFGAKKAYSNIDDMLANEKVDIVDVCTWTAAHAECVIAAANAGIDVMCEKPTCDTLENAVKMRDAVKKNGVNFMLAVPLRYDEKAMYIRSLVDKGEFGDVFYGKTSYVRSRGIPGGWFSCTKYAGGGPVLDIGVHRIDLAWFLMGNPKPYSVTATTSYRIGDYRGSNDDGWAGSAVPDYKFDTEDSTQGFIRFENGASLYFEASWTFNGPDLGATQIAGAKAGCTLDDFKIYRSEGAGMKVETPEGNFNGDIFGNEIDHFINCVRNHKTPCSDIDQAYQLEAMLMAIYESAKTGHEVIIK